MNITELIQTVKKLEKRKGFDKTSKNKLLEMMQKELDLAKTYKYNKNKFDHQLSDLQVLIIQLAIRNKTNLHNELLKHFKHSEKRYKDI
jgi:hypothetical protein